MANAIPSQGHTNDSAIIPALNGGVMHRFALFNVVSPNRRDVEEYLANHADLAPLLEAICARLRDAFGQGVELSLEFYKDPEQQDQYPVLYVRPERYETGILNQIESAISPCMPQLETASGHLLITTDFRRKGSRPRADPCRGFATLGRRQSLLRRVLPRQKLCGAVSRLSHQGIRRRPRFSASPLEEESKGRRCVTSGHTSKLEE
jgi:hypothetical protein